MESLSGVGVLDKAVGVLHALLERPMNLTELQTATGLPRATAHRLAAALEVHHLVRRNDDGRFALGFGCIELGRVAAAEFPIAVAARPILERLRDETAEGVQLYVAEGGLRRCVVSLPAPHSLQWIVPEGVLLSLELGSAGRALTQPATARRSWFESVEEREKGVASVSAGVTARNGAIVAAVSLSGPLERLSRTPGKRFGAAVAAAAEELSAVLPT